jgi:hypothetical protein
MPSLVFTYAPLGVLMYLVGGGSFASNAHSGQRSALAWCTRALLTAQYMAIGGHWVILGGDGGRAGGEEQAAAPHGPDDTGDVDMLAQVALPRAVYVLGLCCVALVVGDAVHSSLGGGQRSIDTAAAPHGANAKGATTTAGLQTDGRAAAQPKLVALIGAVGGVVTMMLGPANGAALTLLALAQAHLHLNVSDSSWLSVRSPPAD